MAGNSDVLIEPHPNEIPDFLSDDFVLANVLNDISNFETGQMSVQNNSQTGCYKYSNFKYI